MPRDDMHETFRMTSGAQKHGRYDRGLLSPSVRGANRCACAPKRRTQPRREFHMSKSVQRASFVRLFFGNLSSHKDARINTYAAAANDASCAPRIRGARHAPPHATENHPDHRLFVRHRPGCRDPVAQRRLEGVRGVSSSEGLRARGA